MIEAPHTEDVAEMMMCAGVDVARRSHDAAVRTARFGGADLAAAERLLRAVELGNTEEQHTRDTAEMLFEGHGAAALSAHKSYVRAEYERCELTQTDTNDLDYWLAGLLIEADQGRRAMGLSLAA
jgi:hypothetical protein